MSLRRLDVAWEVGHLSPSEVEPARWVHASVPGAVQLDIAAADGLPDFTIGENIKQWGWLEDRAFVYRARFARPELQAGESLHLCSEGIDYEYTISLNGTVLLRQVGPYSRVDVDLTRALQDQNELRIQLAPIPRRHAEPLDRSQASAAVKPAVNYGWDFQPRLVPLGIWTNAWLEKRPASCLTETEFAYVLSEDLSHAVLDCRVSGRNLSGRRVRISLAAPDGKTLRSTEFGLSGSDEEIIRFGQVADVNLWWPKNHGPQSLYRWNVQLLGSDGTVAQEKSGRIGFRRARLVMNEGAWKEPYIFPKSRSYPPIQLELNGRRIFCKGSNWVPPDVFPARITEARYREQLQLVADANMDLLRLWGGGGPAHECFYTICDELGIMVWQEFPLACNNYPDDAAYLAVLLKESRAIVQRLRSHPSLVMWCGGNELFNFWSGMTDQSRALRLLNAVCLELDPETPFIATAPLEGMGHGHYVFYDPDRNEEVFARMARAKNTAYTEFGVPGPASVETIRQVVPAEELWPPRLGTAWESHHGIGTWTAETWLCLPSIERYFGPSSSLEELVERGQLMQAQGLICIFEEARRQKPYCSMALNWCFNEPWPCVANNSIVAYPTLPKPAYHAVAKACRPVLASARIPKWKWQAGELFSAELWILNDISATQNGAPAVQAGVARAYLVSGAEKLELLTWRFDALAANVNQAGPVARCLLPTRWAERRFVLRVEVEGKPEYMSEYVLLFEPAAAPVASERSTPVMNL
jgi:beta-mannosidase